MKEKIHPGDKIRYRLDQDDGWRVGYFQSVSDEGAVIQDLETGDDYLLAPRIRPLDSDQTRGYMMTNERRP